MRSAMISEGMMWHMHFLIFAVSFLLGSSLGDWPMAQAATYGIGGFCLGIMIAEIYLDEDGGQ